jgi:shikimate dehydrogenase
VQPTTATHEARQRPNTRMAFRIGLIGAGISASRTPAMHVAEGRAQGVMLDYDLLDTDRVPEGADLAALMARVEAEGYAGVNVTYPWKRVALDLCDEVAPSAKAVGATNTVVFAAGRRTAHNTDYSGFAEGFRQGIGAHPHITALLVGAGGAGGAVAHGLLDSGVQLLFVRDADPDAAERLVQAIEARLGPGRARIARDLRATLAAADGIVNATPVGMAKMPGIPVDLALIEARHWVSDIVYFPLETALLQAARAKGCHTINGSGMAVFQAAAAFALFTGLVPDPARMRATFDSSS